MTDVLRGRYGTHTVQLDVRDFHRAVGDIEFDPAPAVRRPELRAALIAEEARETLEAITGKPWRVIHVGGLRGWFLRCLRRRAYRRDLVAAIDGMCDLLCVVYGTAEEFGVDLAPFWDEVHRTNMAKAGGPVREDGKRLKPEGWQPPDIAGLLERLSGTVAHSSGSDQRG